MSWIAFLLGLLLALAGAAGMAASIDLLTTELGLLYATCGAIGLSGGIIVIAIGLLIRRVDALRAALLKRDEATAPEPERRDSAVPPLLAGIEPVVVPEPVANPADLEFSASTADVAPAPVAVLDEPAEAPEPPINENRKGRLPSLEALDETASELGPAPTLVGRYSAGGANYAIYSDGSIEANTDQGDYKFASMGEFKAFIAAKRN